MARSTDAIFSSVVGRAAPSESGHSEHLCAGRGAVHGLKPLESYRGIVQCDGYAAYKTIADDARTGDAITLAFCWVHLRRQFFDIAKGGSAPIASEALDRIAASKRRFT